MTVQMTDRPLGRASSRVAPGPSPDSVEAAGGGEIPLERVEAELCTLAGQLAAGMCRFLQLLAEFDARRGWAEWGLRSCAHWLSWRCGIDLRTAREQVRVARSLVELPKVRTAFAEGRVSYSKVRAIARVATSDSEEDLLQAALHAPAAQVERLTRGLRRATRSADDEEAPGTDATTGSGRPLRVSWRWDDDGCLVIWGRLGAEDGARLLAGLTRAGALTDSHDPRSPEGVARSGSAEPPTGPDTDGEVGTAETSTIDASGSAEPPRLRPDLAGSPPHDLGRGLVAMADLARTAVDAPLFAPAAEVWVHTDADTLTDAEHTGATEHTPATDQVRTVGRIDDGPPLSEAAIRRLACDGGIRLVVRSRAGRTLDLGRRRRRPTRRQLLALWHRDRGCIVPGCGATRFLHAHHVRPWAQGGATSVDNLVLLCGQHHRALHDGGFTITAHTGQRFTVHGPGGAARPAAPPTRGGVDDLTAAHPDIGPDPLTPDWDGAGLDLPEAVDCYLQSWQIAERRRQPEQTPPPTPHDTAADASYTDALMATASRWLATT